VNRTLISETNVKITNKAPADYSVSREIFPSGADEQLLAPHFFSAGAIEAMKRATSTLPDSEVETVYEQFCLAREHRIVAEIRKACGVTQAKAASIRN
jgi:hypothetical protein